MFPPGKKKIVDPLYLLTTNCRAGRGPVEIDEDSWVLRIFALEDLNGVVFFYRRGPGVFRRRMNKS